MAIYNRALSAAEIAAHYSPATAPTSKPSAALAISPNPVATGGHVTFDASASTDPDGTIAKYEWDLDGNGTYETNTGSTPTAVGRLRAKPQIPISVKVYDDDLGDRHRDQALTVGGAEPQPPVASSPAQPEPGGRPTPRSLRRLRPRKTPTARSSNTNGTSTATAAIETDTGTTADDRAHLQLAGTVQTRPAGHRRQRHDRHGRPRPVTVNAGGVSNYGDTVARHARPGRLLAPRRGSRPELRRQQGQRHRQRRRRVTPRRRRARSPATRTRRSASTAPTTSAASRSTSPAPARPRSSSGSTGTPTTTTTTWRCELTPNFNQQQRRLHRRPERRPGRHSASASASPTRATTSSSPGPAPASGTTTRSSSTPTAPAAQQITPYVDGQPVSYTKTRQRHRRRQLRQLDPLLDVARRRGAVRQRRPRRGRGLQPRPEPAEIAEHTKPATASTGARTPPSPPPPTRSQPATRSASTPPAPATPTARSSSTSGTSTATAASRPTPATTPTASSRYPQEGKSTVGGQGARQRIRAPTPKRRPSRSTTPRNRLHPRPSSATRKRSWRRPA